MRLQIDVKALREQNIHVEDVNTVDSPYVVDLVLHLEAGEGMPAITVNHKDIRKAYPKFDERDQDIVLDKAWEALEQVVLQKIIF